MRINGASDSGRGEILVLLFVIMLSVFLERVVLYSNIDQRERFSVSHASATTWLAMAGFFLSFLPMILWTGSGSLVAIDRFQNVFPYIFIARTPGAFFSAFSGFVSMLILLKIGPAQVDGETHTSGAWGRVLFWTHRHWVVGLMALWIYAFWGGGADGIISFLGFNLRLIAVLCLVLWIHVSFPRARVSDISKFLLLYVLPVGLFGVLIDMFYLAIIRWNA